MSQHPMSSSTILIVDPDPIMRTGVAAVLHQLGVECVCARDAEAANKYLSQSRPDLIVSELELDGFDSLSLWSAWRQRYQLAEVPLLILADEISMSMMDRIRSLGWTYYLRRPFDPNLFQEFVDKLLWMPMRRHAIPAALQSAPHFGQALQPIQPSVKSASEIPSSGSK